MNHVAMEAFAVLLLRHLWPEVLFSPQDLLPHLLTFDPLCATLFNVRGKLIKELLDADNKLLELVARPVGYEGGMQHMIFLLVGHLILEAQGVLPSLEIALLCRPQSRHTDQNALVRRTCTSKHVLICPCLFRRLLASLFPVKVFPEDILEHAKLPSNVGESVDEAVGDAPFERLLAGRSRWDGGLGEHVTHEGDV
jgi:hypothetical protein